VTRWLVLIALFLAFVGIFSAAVLSVGHVLDLPVPCGASRGCGAVAAHPASKLGGVPIAFFGVVAYMMMIALLAAVSDRRARLGLLGISAFGTLISAGLLAYSHFVIRATCAWCVASGAAMTLLLVCAVVIVRTHQPLAAIRPIILWGLGILAAGAVGVQAGMMERASRAPPVSADRLTAVAAAELVDPAKSLGPADAPVTVVVFADLWCPACRAAHEGLVRYQEVNPTGVRLAFRHLPLWQIRGHESSRAAAALGEIAAEQAKFWTFVEAVYARQRPLDRDGYLRLLGHLGFDPNQAENRLADPHDPAVQRVLWDEAVAEGLGINATPTFIVILDGEQRISANQRTLPQILNLPAVQSRLARAAQRDFAEPGGTPR